jgi:glycosyltransferase involved in cell wall biosynthesis
MLGGARVVVVVPAFQEEAHVGGVITNMPRWVDRVVLVDDGSTDRTAEVAREAARARGVELVVVCHPQRRGVGAAIASGYKAALAEAAGATPNDALCVMAGDGQMHPGDLEAVARPVVEGRAAYVKGERFSSPGVRSAMGLPRWVGGQVFSSLTALAVGVPLTDSQCGFTALARSAASELDLDGLWPSFGYPNDILGQLAARGLALAEVAVRPVYGTETSKLRLRHLPPIFFLIGRAAWRRRLGRGQERANS